MLEKGRDAEKGLCGDSVRPGIWGGGGGGQKADLLVQTCFVPSSGLVPSAVLIVAKKCPG